MFWVFLISNLTRQSIWTTYKFHTYLYHLRLHTKTWIPEKNIQMGETFRIIASFAWTTGSYRSTKDTNISFPAIVITGFTTVRSSCHFAILLIVIKAFAEVNKKQNYTCIIIVFNTPPGLYFIKLFRNIPKKML